jgi:hypothetical protein
MFAGLLRKWRQEDPVNGEVVLRRIRYTSLAKLVPAGLELLEAEHVGREPKRGVKKVFAAARRLVLPAL